MNFVKYFLGYFAEKAYNCRMYYRQINNMSIVINRGGIITGSVNLSYPENIEIGKNSYINGGDISASPNAYVKIGENCMISYNVHIRTDMHIHKDVTIPMKFQGCTEADIIIEDDVWIGYGVQIMPGVHIEKGCIIGAGAIVTSDTTPYGVYVGVPARRIKDRTDNNKAMNK